MSMAGAWLFLLFVFSGLVLSSPSATLVWNENPEADLGGYRVYIFSDAGSQEIDVLTETNLDLSFLPAGVAYSIYVRAYNLFEIESVPSEEIAYELPLEMPELLAQTSNIVLRAAAAFPLRVQVKGSQPLQYQWFRDGAPVEQATNETYFLPPDSALSAGSYHAEVSNLAGKITTQPILVLLVPLPLVFTPIITVDLADVTAARGSPAELRFRFQALLGSNSTVEWWKDDQRLAAAEGSSLLIAEVQLADAGSYFAVVRSGTTAVVTRKAELRVTAPPRIVRNPAAQNVPLGGETFLAVIADGTGPFGYQWRKDGVALEGQTSRALIKTNAQPSDSGLYSVRVTNPAGSVESAAALLNVPVLTSDESLPPRIVKQPKSRVVGFNSATTLFAEVEWTDGLGFQWWKDGAPIDGATSQSYELVRTRFEDSGIYFLLVTNAFGSAVTDTCELQVQFPPSIEVHPRDSAAGEGSLALFLLQVSGSDLKFQWYKDGVKLPGETSPLLVVRLQDHRQAGNYHVVVQNEAGLVESRKAELEFLALPRILAQDQSLRVKEGTPVELNVEVEEGARLSYAWFKDNSPISDLAEAQFRIDSAAPGDSGFYFLEVANDQGSIRSEPIELVVERVVREPALSVSKGGGGIVIEIQGTPEAEYELQISGDLRSAVWITQQSVTLDQDGAASIELPSSGSVQFLRARANPSE